MLSLYRTILRGTGRIGDARARAETRHFVRAEFERDRALQDMVLSTFALCVPLSGSGNEAARLSADLAHRACKNHIRYLLSTAKTEWERMEKYIGPT